LDVITVMPGRVDHHVVGRYYALMDICPFPRKPWPVAELVSPLKPLEAMAHGRAVVVSDVAAMSDMVDEGVTGRRFRKGDLNALAEVLATLLASDTERAALGTQARQWVVEHRSWHQSAVAVSHAYEAAIKRRGTAAP
jgi:glycosyltransferase involved in cell wall biosynthesis